MPPYPEQPDYYSEDTQAAPYGGYDPEPGRPEPPTPWYRRPLALVGAGAAGVVVLGLAVYAVINLASGSPAHGPATTTTPTPSASVSTTATTTPAEPTRRRGGPGAPPETVTQTVTPEPSGTDTSTVPPSDTATTTVPPTTQTSTVTQTVTVPPRRPFQPRP